MRLMKASLAVMAAFLAVTSAAIAQEYTSVEEVKASQDAADFAIQGEYAVPETNQFFQVIARGDGKFDIVGYRGGLPGEGWDRSMARFFGKGEIKGDRLVVIGEKMDIPKKGDDRSVVFDDEQKTKCDLYGRRDGSRFLFGMKGKEYEAKRLERKSPTLGEKAPEGAFVVFDGTNLDNFAEGAKMNEEVKTLWSEAMTKPFELRPYKLHIEFMTSFMPRGEGQGRSNSGVYIANCYECQVLDSFGLEGENNECGGFYQCAQPIVNMAFPPLTWQTYDFDYAPAQYDGGKKVKNARITVRHNGVVIQDNMELPDATPGQQGEANEARPLFLQGHGNKVQYRNIWVEYK